MIKLSPHIAVSTGEFSAAECENVFIESARFKGEQGDIDTSDDLEHIRSGKVKGLIPDEDNKWLYERIAALFNDFNDKVVHQDWTGYIECIQFAEYEVGDHYDWHFDGFEETGRKLSMSIQLANGYQGGTLQVGLPSNSVEVGTAPGTAACFPSWMPHTVEPVTKGTRYSLVAWGHGPAVR